MPVFKKKDSPHCKSQQQAVNCRAIARRLNPDDLPPDLAIEIDVTSKTTLNAYEAIGVPELWIYNIGKFSIYLLRDGKYVKSDTSPNFAEIEIAEVIPTVVQRSWLVGSVQVSEFEAMIGKK